MRNGKGGGVSKLLIRKAFRYLRKQTKRANSRAKTGHMPPKTLRHVFQGENRKGFHYRPGGKDWPTSRVKRNADGSMTGYEKHPDGNGVYKADVEFFNPQTGQWHAKKGFSDSTFFPDHWTPRELDDAVAEAFRNATVKRTDDRFFSGVGNGIEINGRFDAVTGEITAAYPGFPYNG